MATKHAQPDLPADAITVSSYRALESYLSKFAAGDLDLLLLVGRPGTGKTEIIKQVLGVNDSPGQQQDGEPNIEALYIEGHAQAFGLYQSLWRYRDAPVVLDDLDRLYTQPDCVRLLKPLCSSRPVKRLTWLTSATLSASDVPPEFTTRSNVILVANEWRSLNANVRALEDRAIILHFSPANIEVHRKVADWFDDPEAFRFIGSYLPYIPVVSMRHYEKARRLRIAGFTDWKKSVLQMVLPDRAIAAVAGLMLDPVLQTDDMRITRFVTETGLSRATYYRIKKSLPRPCPPPKVVLKAAAVLRLAGN